MKKKGNSLNENNFQHATLYTTIFETHTAK
jgi:hypothetical protein